MPRRTSVGTIAAKSDRAENDIMSVEFVKNVIIDGTDNPYPGGAADYESKVSLDAIKGTGTGTTVIGFFALRSHRVWIVPPAGLQSQVSAGAGAVNATAAFPPGRQLRDIDGSIDARHRTGVGGGSDSLLHFHPIHWQNGVSGAFTTPKEVLVHELFHAVRQVFGMLLNKPLGGDFLSVEELYSIFVENMYANEKGLALRNTHSARSSDVSPDHSMAHNPTFRDPMRELFAMMPAIGKCAGAGEKPLQSVPRLAGIQPRASVTRAGGCRRAGLAAAGCTVHKRAQRLLKTSLATTSCLPPFLSGTKASRSPALPKTIKAPVSENRN
jgi:hypothetical protein